jgi:hypothetical protein
METKADAYIEVRFKTPEEGGRKSAVRGDYYPCPFAIDGELFECRVLLGGDGLDLGKTYELAVKFFYPDKVMPLLAEGKRFALLEGREVATGRVVRVVAGND